MRSFFGRYGEVVEVVIMYDQEKKKSRGFGFLSFMDEGACSRAVAEHFVNIQNKQVSQAVSVNFCNRLPLPHGHLEGPRNSLTGMEPWSGHDFNVPTQGMDSTST